MLEDLNSALAQIFAMNPYYNNMLWMEYFTDTTVSKSITAREEAWITAHPNIHVGCMRDDLPFAAFNEKSGKAEGLVVDIFSYLNETLLDGKGTFSYVFYDDNELLFSDLKNGIVDYE